MESAALQRVAGMVNDLPALPAVAQQALALLADPSTEPEDLQAVLSRDAALSLRVLRLANSAFYRRKREISTLTSAILLLGFKTIQSLILSSAVHRVLSSSGSVAGALWDHSFAAGAACRELARRTGGVPERVEEAFLAGLFHDVAKGVLAAKFPGLYAKPLGVAGEVEVLGFDHAQLAQVLLAKWEIPPALAAAVGAHHEPDVTGLGALTAVADWLVWESAPGVGAEPPGEPAALASLGLVRGALEEVRTSLAGSLAEEKVGHGGA